MKKFYLVIFFVAFISDLQAQLDIDVEFRPRAELRNGYKTLIQEDVDPAFFIDQRARFNLGYTYEKATLFVSFQDIRTWGSTNQLNTSDDSFSIHQVYTKLKLNDYLGVKIGRQEIAYDDHRILGSVGWAQQARSHDALLFQFNKDNSKVNLALAFNQAGPALSSTTYLLSNNYKTMQYIWFNQEFSDAFHASFLLMNLGFQSTLYSPIEEDEQKTNFNQTIGTRMKINKSKLKYSLGAYYQFGSDKDWDETSINAYEINADISYNFKDKNWITIGYEILSGSESNADENNSFTPYYGTNHKFNGLMDYFYVGNHVGNVGLHDLYAKLKYNFDKMNVNVHGHFFQADKEFGAESKQLGTEIDIFSSHNLSKGIQLKYGYSHFFYADEMKVLKNVTNPKDAQNWLWLMLQVKLNVLHINSNNEG